MRILILLASLLLTINAYAASPVTAKIDDQLVTLTIEQGWHIYGVNTQDFGVPLKVFADDQDITDFISFPPPLIKTEKIASEVLKSEIYETSLSFSIPSTNIEELKITGGACKEQCIWFEQTLTIAPLENSNSNLLYILILAFLGGLILNIMPCVLPVIVIKINSLINHSGKSLSDIRASALATVAGMMVSFAMIGLLASALKYNGENLGWGLQFQNPKFIYFLALLMVLYAATLWGDFELKLPFTINNKLASYSSSFGSGFFATLMATPCTAPFLSTALGFSLILDYRLIVIIYLAIGLGFALPFIALALFSRAAKYIPTPGRWMLSLQRIFALLMLMSATWLLYVLNHQIGVLPTLSAIGFIILIKFILSSKIKFRLLIISFLAILSFIMPFNLANKLQFEQVHLNSKWETFSVSKLEYYLNNGDSVLIDITADWCLTCKYNKFMVFEDDDFMNYLTSKNIKLLRGDLTNPNPEISKFLALHQRNGIPFNLLYLKGNTHPHVLPVLLSKDDIRRLLSNH